MYSLKPTWCASWRLSLQSIVFVQGFESALGPSSSSYSSCSPVLDVFSSPILLCVCVCVCLCVLCACLHMFLRDTKHGRWKEAIDLFRHIRRPEGRAQASETTYLLTMMTLLTVSWKTRHKQEMNKASYLPPFWFSP